MGSAYRAVEAQLYGLGEAPEARPARPQLQVIPRRGRPGPRGPFRESVRRLDLSIATNRLSAEDMAVVRDHYIFRVRRVARAQREPIIRRLISMLGE